MDALSPAMVGTVAAGTWFGLFVVTQWVVLHWLFPAGRARVLLLGYGLCCMGLAITVFLLTDRGRLLSGVFGGLTMGCLLVLYVPLYYVVANSLSGQSIVLLLAGQGSLAREELYRRFASHHLLHGRLLALVNSGYVIGDGTAFRITGRGRRLIAPFLFVKALWRLGPGG